VPADSGDLVRGKLIAIEGVDGCGKSTHARMLAGGLRSRGYEVVLTDEPTDGPIGGFIKLALRGGKKLPAEIEALMFAADRVQHIAGTIAPALKAGKIVVTERYVCSSLAYQSARGAPISWLKGINKHAPAADLTILIDVPAEEGIKRVKRARRLDAFERDLTLQRRVRSAYLRLAKREGMKVVNGARGVEEVQADVRRLVGRILKRRFGRRKEGF